MDKTREELERGLVDGLYEIVVGGHICLIGKEGYIDYILGSKGLCSSAESDGENITKL